MVGWSTAALSLIPKVWPLEVPTSGAYQVDIGLSYLSPFLPEVDRGSPSCLPELAGGFGRTTPDVRLISGFPSPGYWLSSPFLLC